MEGPPVSEGEGTPLLAMAGFSGPLALLLNLARAQQIDLGGLPLPDLVDQLAAALHRAAPMTPLSQKGDWVVMTAWLVLLRSRLLLPGDSRTQAAAEAEMDQLRGRLVALEEIQVFAAWLERRPRLGRDVFARGRPEFVGTTIGAAPEIDVIAFLWASLALFDDDAPPDTASVYRPMWLDLCSVQEARARILDLLADGQPLGRFLPPGLTAADTEVRRRSAWTSLFTASLELAKQGEIAVAQEAAFTPIQLRPAVNADREAAEV